MEFIVVTEATSNLPRIISIRHIVSVFGTATSPPRAAFVTVGSFTPTVSTHSAQEVLTRMLAAGVAVDLRT